MIMEQSLEGKGGEEEAGAEDVKSFWKETTAGNEMFALSKIKKATQMQP